MLRPSLIALSALIVVAAACEPAIEAPPPATPEAAPPATPPPPAGPRVVETTLESTGLDPAALDRSIDPCTDFYQFACGGWLAKTEIPADKPSWGRSFSVIADRNEAALHQILEDAAAQKSGDPAIQKIGAYYGACMDETAIEAAKTKPIKPLLDLVKKVRDDKTLSSVVTELHKQKIWALFDISDTQDFKDATRVIAELDQNGLGLPDRDYYVKDDEKSKDLRLKYVKHVERMMKLAGWSVKDSTAAALDVMRIETALARSSKTRVERRDPAGLYNKTDRAGVAKTTPAFLWDDYFKAMGLANAKEVNLTAPQFFKDLSALIGAEKPKAWQNYLSWHVIRATAQLLPKAFVDEAFTIESSLTGQKEQRARWKRCVAATDGALGELLAQPWLKDHFSPESKEATLRYVHEISTAFGQVVEKLDWMDPKTKARANEKLGTLAYLIGYPNRWKTYDFDVKAKSYAENALTARAFDLRRHIAKVGKPVDREDWHMSPPTVNAYYEATLNHMVFPAGILQPPFFSPKAAVPVNLGGMGMVVGHELTHGFDDKGSQFDAKGNLDNWWTAEDIARFKAKTDCVADQYGQYEALPGLKLNGQLTLGENIADGGGVKLAFYAYRAMRKDAPEVTNAGGFTEDQQFFLGVGQAWCTNQREEYARLRVQTDPHSPARFRVNGPLSNLPEFAATFSCKDGARMKRANACGVW